MTPALHLPESELVAVMERRATLQATIRSLNTTPSTDSGYLEDFERRHNISPSQRLFPPASSGCDLTAVQPLEVVARPIAGASTPFKSKPSKSWLYTEKGQRLLSEVQQHYLSGAAAKSVSPLADKRVSGVPTTPPIPSTGEITKDLHVGDGDSLDRAQGHVLSSSRTTRPTMQPVTNVRTPQIARGVPSDRSDHWQNVSVSGPKT